MIKNVKRFQAMKWLMIIGTLFTAVTSFVVKSSPHLSAAWELWYPYQFNDEKGELRGVDIHFFEAVMRQANLSYGIDEMDWKMQLFMIKTGQLDVALGVSRTPEREQYALFSAPYRQEKVSLFMKKGQGQKHKLADLASLAKTNLKIGTEQGYYYGDEFDRLSHDPDFSTRFHEVVDIEENVRLLLNGKLDGLLADPHTMKAVMEKFKITGKLEAHPLAIYSTDIHFMFSKKSVTDRTVQIINDAITTLKSNGQAQRLLGI